MDLNCQCSESCGHLGNTLKQRNTRLHPVGADIYSCTDSGSQTLLSALGFQWSAEKVASFFLLSLFHSPDLTLNIFLFVGVSVSRLSFVSSKLRSFVLNPNECAVLCGSHLPLLCL